MKLFTGGKQVLEYAIMFTFAVFVILIGLWVVDYADNGALKKAKELILQDRSEIATVKSEANITAGALAKVANMAASNELRVNDILKRLEEEDKELQLLQEQCARLGRDHVVLQDKHTETREILSKKKTVVKMPTGPFQVEILDGRGGDLSPRTSKKSAGLGRGIGAVIRGE